MMTLQAVLVVKDVDIEQCTLTKSQRGHPGEVQTHLWAVYCEGEGGWGLYPRCTR